MKQPFFSIVIPTYNRCQKLRLAIKAILDQDYRNFELIVSDNASGDKTKEVVRSFKDKRIRYFRNKKNIGAERNYQKVFSLARGKYIFSQGDDDIILFKNTLTKIKKILDKKKFGFIRLNLIEREFVGSGLRKSIVSLEKDMEIKKQTAPEKIISFFRQVAAGHLAGLVIRNSANLGKKINDFQETPWIKLIFESTQKHGAYYLSNYYMVITWSQGDIFNHYKLHPDGKLMFEKYTDFVFSKIPIKKLNDYKWNFYKTFIMLQPAVKLYSDNKNLVKFNRRLFELEPRLKNNLFFWIFFSLAWITPKFIWRLVRAIQHKNKNTIQGLKNLKKINKRFAYLIEK